MQKGDFVVYITKDEPRVGKLVNTMYNGKLVILPKFGNRVLRKKKFVLSLNDLFKKYEPLLKGESR